MLNYHNNAYDFSSPINTHFHFTFKPYSTLVGLWNLCLSVCESSWRRMRDFLSVLLHEGNLLSLTCSFSCYGM
jgi:hypothetical protein